MEKFLKLAVFAFFMIFGEQLWASRPPRHDSKKSEKNKKNHDDCDALTQSIARCSVQQSLENAHVLRIETNFSDDTLEKGPSQVIERRWCYPRSHADKNFVSQGSESPETLVGIGELKKNNHNQPLKIEELE